MNLRHTSLLPGVARAASPKEFGLNPDSSSSIDITDVDEKNEVEVESQLKNYQAAEEGTDSASKDEGVNLSLHRGKKAAITLIKQKEESVSSTDKNGLKTSRSGSTRHSDVWRPY